MNHATTDTSRPGRPPTRAGATLNSRGPNLRAGLVPLLPLIGVAILLVAAGCASTTAKTPPRTKATQSGTNVANAAAAPTRMPEPDVLADPAVPPGGCKTIVYTPPTAKEALPGELCRPQQSQRDVAVVIVHGGSGVGGSYLGMRMWANRYLAEGYVTFLPEYHLFRPGGESPVFPRPEQNIKAAVQFVRGAGNALGISKDRIVVQGQSAGARLAGVAFTTADDPWFAGPELYPGIPDQVDGLIGFYHPYDGTMQYADQYYGGPEGSTDPGVIERLDRADALAHADRAHGPALFLTGSQDWSVIAEQQAAFALALHRQSRSAASVVIPGGGHGFDEGGDRLSKLGEESAVRTLAWLNDNFPQQPARPAQISNPDLATAPTYTGAPPTTYPPRPQSRANTSSGGNRSGGGSGTRTGDGQTSPASTNTTRASGGGDPTTTSPATPPPTTATPEPAPTTAPTVPPTTAAPTTLPVTTSSTPVS